MKLIRCLRCGDVFSIHFESKECQCKNARGMYIDNLNAVYHTKTNKYLLLGFANSSFKDASTKKILDDEQGIVKDWGYTFNAFIIPEPCSSFKPKCFLDYQKLIDKQN